MANEIKVTTYVKVTNGSFVDNWTPSEISIDQAASGAVGGAVSIATTDTALNVTGISTKGIARFRNLDATNYVQIGPYSGGTFYPFIRLKPGESAVMRLETAATIYAKANTAAVKLQYQIYEA